jgi:hypothetical protein
LGNGIGYYIIQSTTLLILAVAANTSFAGFPRVLSILAKDGFMPRQFTALGDRLVFNNGIIVLSIATAALIIFFNGDSHALIPLFAIGCFLAFTLSQAGMVRHWWRERKGNWKFKLGINGLGALVTGLTTIINIYNKFLSGAWLTIIAIPLFVFVFYRISTHYRSVRKQLTLNGLPPSLKPSPTPRVVVPISGIHRGIFDAVNFARCISPNVTAIYIEVEPDTAKKMQAEWQEWWTDIPLVVVPSPYRSLIRPLVDFLDKTDKEANDGQLAVVVLPELIPAKGWQELLHNQTHLLIKAALLYRRREKGFQRVIIDVPFHLRK